MAYVFATPALGLPAITSTILLTQTGSKVSAPHVWKLGEIVRAYDATLGGAEFIYLAGCAGTLAGLVVSYDVSTSITALTSTSGVVGRGQPLAVAMAANLAGYGGWYQISGAAVILKTAVKVDPALAAGMNVFLSATAGRVMQTSVASRQVVGARFATTVTVTSTTSTAVVTINRPSQQSRIT